MFQLVNSHLQAHSLQVKSQDAAHTLGSQCVYISKIITPCYLQILSIKINVCTAPLQFSS